MVVDKVRQVRGPKSVFAMLNLETGLCLAVCISISTRVLEPNQLLDDAKRGAESSLYAHQKTRMTCVPQPHSQTMNPGGGQGFLISGRTEPTFRRVTPQGTAEPSADPAGHLSFYPQIGMNLRYCAIGPDTDAHDTKSDLPRSNLDMKLIDDLCD